MEVNHDDAYKAGRLLQWGLDLRARPAQEPEYQELVNGYLDRSSFRTLVREVAQGLGLMILDVGEQGIILGPDQGSIFALKPGNFRLTSSSTDDRLLDGLVQLAIAAAIFPKAQDLDEDVTIARPPTTVEEVEEILRHLCERIEEESRTNPDPTVADEEQGLYESWRVYQQRLAAMETRDDRKAQRTTRRIIEFGFERLREFGCFTRVEQEALVTYQPTYRYQVLMKELAATSVFKAFHRVLEAGQNKQGNKG